jgi:uncharacterized protein
VTSSLHDRLQRLHRPQREEPASLDRVEREVLGDLLPSEGEVLSLKQRLERLVAAATQKEKERRRSPAAVPLEELVAGMRVENERGEFFRVDSEVHLEVRHGDVPLSRVQLVSPGTIPVLADDAALDGFDLQRAAFLDTETTGLAGGTGTAAFLIGLGFFDGDRFRVRQYFMRDYHEEAALLRALAEELRRFDQLVTFNGKMFDVPLLEARFRLNRDRFPLAGVPHLDLLHPSRRLWKARLESCRLQSLEAALLGLRRSGDIPGEQIPQVYFDWVRRRDARMLARVFEHNRQDIVSLAALAVEACRWLEESRAEDPRDVFSLARVLERALLHERSAEQYRRVVELDAGTLRGPALLRLAWAARREGAHGQAAELWRQAGEAGEAEGWRALAVHHEHRARDLEQALLAVERGLQLVEPTRQRDRGAWRLAEGLERRRARLLRKTARG